MNANLSLNGSTNASLGWINHHDKLSAFEAEKRRYPRYQAQLEVTCTFYDNLKNDFEIVSAKVENKSEAGLLLTTNEPLEIGMPILVRLKHFSEKDAEDELNDGIHARVVRCDEIFSPDERPCYRIAIEYFELCQ
ncbi:MAG: PilZ domain-containing protein [Desulfobacterales bacterium]|nr:MAG: PilZ domain-containing protein [Desulfobacterales bacterium]